MCKLEKAAIANALQLEAARATPRQPFPALLRRHTKFDVTEPIHCRTLCCVFAADTLLYAVTLTFDL